MERHGCQYQQGIRASFRLSMSRKVENFAQGLTATIIILLMLAAYSRGQTNPSGVLYYVRVGGPTTFNCGFNAIAATLTQLTGCGAPAAGLSFYITSIAIQTTTTTSGTYAFQSGTGTNCGTGTTAVFPVSATGSRFNAPITSQPMANINFPVPIKLTTASALCVIGVATNTVSGQVTGFTAP